MTPSKLAGRRFEAQKRIKASTQVFAEKLGVDPPDFDSIKRRGGPEVVRMMEHELLADWLEDVVEAATFGPERASQMRAERRRGPNGRFLPANANGVEGEEED